MLADNRLSIKHVPLYLAFKEREWGVLISKYSPQCSWNKSKQEDCQDEREISWK